MLLEDIIKADTEKTFLPSFPDADRAINYVDSKEASLELPERVVLLSNLGKMFPDNLKVREYIDAKIKLFLGELSDNPNLT